MAGFFVSGDACIKETLWKALRRAGIFPSTDDGGEVELVATESSDAGQAVERIHRARAGRVWVVSSEEFDPQYVISAVRAGATNFFRFPQDLDTLGAALREVFTSKPAQGFEPMLGRGQAMCCVREYLQRIAPSDSNVLITGETGTGKELAAELIHQNSGRAAGPYVTVNCAAIPDTLFESELFGHERGAFTGAYAMREGKFRQAEGGTLLLDEVGDMSPLAQAKLLRVLETHRLERLGGNKSLVTNVRVLSATNQDLESLMEQKLFRRDLFYRLKVAHVHLPPLAERREDIASLVENEARYWSTLRNKPFVVAPEVLSALENHSWPGNVRELKNLMESLHLTCAASTVQIEDLPASLRIQVGAAASPDERERLLSALRETHWNKSQAAQRLHWSRMTLYRKMAAHSIPLIPGRAVGDD